jgi:hypothetical protein
MTDHPIAADSRAEDLGGLTPSTAFWDPRKTNAKRSIILCAFGSALGLAIAGYGLFTANGTVSNAVSPENVALVNQRPILRTDFIAQTELVTGKPFGEVLLPDRLNVLDDMVREELMVQRGLELDFPGTDPDTRAALVAAVEQQAVASITSSQPNDAELRRSYDADPAAYASEGVMVLHHFLVPASADAMERAKRALEALEHGATRGEIGRQFGAREIIPEHTGQEQFYFAERTHLGDRFFAAALKLESGAISGPITAADGVHLIQMVKNTHPEPISFDKARSQVLSNYVQSERQRLTNATESYLREKADIRIADDYAGAYAARQKKAP